MRRSLTELARVLDNRCQSISVSQRAFRSGRFSYIGEQSERFPIDDFTIDDFVLIIGSFCNIRTAQGTFATYLSRGRIIPDRLYHVLRGATEQDTRYLRHALANTTALGYLSGDNIAERLELEALDRIPIFWPASENRQAFTRLMDLIEQELRVSPSQIDELLRLGDAVFAHDFSAEALTVSLESVGTLRQGEFRTLDSAFDYLHPPIYSGRGAFASTAEALATGPTVIIGQMGDLLATHYALGPSAPNADTIYIENRTKGAEATSLPSLYFALRAAGLVKSAREAQEERSVHGVKLERLADLQIPWGDETRRRDFDEKIEPVLLRIHSLEKKAVFLRELRHLVAPRFLFGDAFALLSPPVGYPLYPHREDDVEKSEPVGTSTAAPGDPTGDPTGDLASDPTSDPTIAPTIAPTMRFYQAWVERLAQNGPLPSCDDLFWELVPLAYLRAKLGDGHFERLLAEVEAAAAGQESPAEAIDSRLTELAERNEQVAFLPQLGYQGSLLNPRQLAEALCSLRDVDPSFLTGEAFTAWYASTTHADAQFAALPPALRNVIAGLIRTVAPNAASLYDPYVGSGELLRLAHSVLPEARVVARTDTFSSELLLRLAFDLEDSPLEIEALRPLVAEASPTKADLVLCFPPPNQGNWAEEVPAKDDPRWTLGVPPKNRANFAWIQQVISHMDVGSHAVLLLCNAPLHSNRGIERQLRIALAQSGFVKAVISLPGRLFEDERPPCSLILLEKRADSLEGTLFVDMQDWGVEIGSAPTAKPGRRILPDDAGERFLGILSEFCSDPSRFVAKEGVARFVTREEIADNEFLLTPWTYVYAGARAGTGADGGGADGGAGAGGGADGRHGQGYGQDLRALDKGAQAELDAYIAELLRLVSV